MTIKEIHDIIDFYRRKNQGGHLSHEEMDAVLHRAQIQYMDKLKPAFVGNQQVHDALLPFKATYGFTNGTSPDGLVTLPVDYLHLLAVETNVLDSGNLIYPSVAIVDEGEVAQRKSSQLIPVGVKYPIGVLQAGNKIQLHPAQAAAGTVYYLRKPVAPVFAYTQEGRAITYNAAGSVQLQWNEPSTEKIIFIALQLLGIAVEDMNLIQFAQNKEAAA